MKNTYFGEALEMKKEPRRIKLDWQVCLRLNGRRPITAFWLNF
jgi:hypothetical protein